jgi:DNA-binding NtrC family response regulator
VELEDLPEEIRHAASRPVATLGKVLSLEDMEKEYILSAMELNGGNQTRTAEQLKIGPATLYRKLKSYGMIRARQNEPADTE